MENYFSLYPTGYIPKDMARYLQIPQISTMEVVLNAWLLHFYRRGLVREGEIFFDIESKKILSGKKVKVLDSLPINLLPLLLSSFFKERKSKNEAKIYSLAINLAQELKTVKQ